MLGIMTLFIALATQIGYTIFCLVTNEAQPLVKNAIRISAFALLSLLMLLHVYEWGFSWYGLFLYLAILTVFSIVYFIRKPQSKKPFKKGKAIRSCIIADTYCNMVVSANAKEAYAVEIKQSGNLNFTDLPLFSPFFANMLGTGEVDSRYCIETMNQTVLDFFNYTLKGSGSLHLQNEY